MGALTYVKSLPSHVPQHAPGRGFCLSAVPQRDTLTRPAQGHSTIIAAFPPLPVGLGSRVALVSEAVYIERDGSVAAQVMQEMG